MEETHEEGIGNPRNGRNSRRNDDVRTG